MGHEKNNFGSEQAAAVQSLLAQQASEANTDNNYAKPELESSQASMEPLPSAEETAADSPAATHDTSIEQSVNLNSAAEIGLYQEQAGASEPGSPDADNRYQNKYATQYRAELDLMPDGVEKNYLLDRVFPQMKYYSQSSSYCKKMYHRLTILCLVFNGIVPFVMLLDQVRYIGPFVKYLVAAFSSAAGILTAVLALKKHRELWVQYRICLEQMKRAVNMFFMNAGEFAELEDNPEKRQKVLFAVFENISVSEHNQWAVVEQKDDKIEDR